MNVILVNAMLVRDFFKDRLIIILGLTTATLAFLNVLLVIVRVDLDQARVIFRHWLINGNSQFYTSSPTYLYSFIGLAILVFFSSWMISYKVYDSFKPAAYFTLTLAAVVLTASLSVSQALFRL